MGDLSAFVISSKDGESLRISDFQRNQESHGLDGIISTIYVVSHEEVVGFGGLTTDFEEFAQVVELAVDVTAYRNWG